MAKKKSNLLKTQKEIKNDVKDSIFESVVSTIAGVASNAGYGLLKDKMPDKVKKFTGVIIGGAGAGLNVAAKHPLLKAAAHGMSGASGALIIEDLAPENIKQKLGLAGIGNANPDNVDTISDQDLIDLEDEMIRELEKDAEDVPDEYDERPGLDEG